MDEGFIPSYILKFLIKNRNLCRDIVILIMEDHSKAIFRVLSVGEIQIATFINMN